MAAKAVSSVMQIGQVSSESLQRITKRKINTAFGLLLEQWDDIMMVADNALDRWMPENKLTKDVPDVNPEDKSMDLSLEHCETGETQELHCKELLSDASSHGRKLNGAGIQDHEDPLKLSLDSTGSSVEAAHSYDSEMFFDMVSVFIDIRCLLTYV